MKLLFFDVRLPFDGLWLLLFFVIAVMQLVFLLGQLLVALFEARGPALTMYCILMTVYLGGFFFLLLSRQPLDLLAGWFFSAWLIIIVFGFRKRIFKTKP